MSFSAVVYSTLHKLRVAGRIQLQCGVDFTGGRLYVCVYMPVSVVSIALLKQSVQPLLYGHGAINGYLTASNIWCSLNESCVIDLQSRMVPGCFGCGIWTTPSKVLALRIGLSLFLPCCVGGRLTG